MSHLFNSLFSIETDWRLTFLLCTINECVEKKSNQYEKYGEKCNEEYFIFESSECNATNALHQECAIATLSTQS